MKQGLKFLFFIQNKLLRDEFLSVDLNFPKLEACFKVVGSA